MEVGKVYQIKI